MKIDLTSRFDIRFRSLILIYIYIYIYISINQSINNQAKEGVSTTKLAVDGDVKKQLSKNILIECDNVAQELTKLAGGAQGRKNIQILESSTTTAKYIANLLALLKEMSQKCTDPILQDKLIRCGQVYI